LESRDHVSLGDPRAWVLQVLFMGGLAPPMHPDAEMGWARGWSRFGCAEAILVVLQLQPHFQTRHPRRLHSEDSPKFQLQEEETRRRIRYTSEGMMEITAGYDFVARHLILPFY
jgi:hypothetical protein